MSSWPRQVVALTRAALEPLADAERAAGAFSYMKGVAPFLGITAPARRAALRSAWADLSAPTSDELGSAAVFLMKQREREFHYAAYDLLARYIRHADEYFLAKYVEPLLTTKPWWDTVDGLVNAAVSPLCLRFDASQIIHDWSESGNRWLVRAAITHQRGWKSETDVRFVLSLCDRHWQDREFFVAKAIGWVLRDLTVDDRPAVVRFLKQHDTKNRVAIREAERGLRRTV